MNLRRVPVSLKAANAFVAKHHRHHKPVVGHKFSIGAAKGNSLVGVVIVGRPVSRHRDNGVNLEVTRLCTDGTYNACSFLYAAAARAAKEMGYHKIGTYILDEELGSSLKASSWQYVYESPGGSWSCKTRKREDKAPLNPKKFYERTLNTNLPDFLFVDHSRPQQEFPF